MSAGRNDANVIGIFVNRKIVHRRQPIKVLGAWSAQLDHGADVNFASLPALDRNRTYRGSDDCDCAAIAQAAAIVTRRGARQQPRGLRRLLVFLGPARCLDIKSGK